MSMEHVFKRISTYNLPMCEPLLSIVRIVRYGNLFGDRIVPSSQGSIAHGVSHADICKVRVYFLTFSQDSTISGIQVAAM